MKSEFIKQLIEVLSDFPVIFKQESLQYKMMRLGGYKPNKVDSALYNLNRRGIFEKRKGGLALTKNGNIWFKKHRLNYFQEQIKLKKWDKRWRIIIFDIPKQLHSRRSYFQKKIKSFGFYALQKSVYVFPYACEQELGIIAEQYKLSEYIDILFAFDLGTREEEVRKYYGI